MTHFSSGYVLRPQARLLLIAAAALVLCASGVLAQETQAEGGTSPQSSNGAVTIPRFDVISVKQNETGRGWNDGITDEGYSATNVTLNWMLPEAFAGFDSDRIVGAPSWAGTNRYDIEAKVDAADIPALKKLDSKQRYSMIQQILADRFQFKVHFVTKDFPVYNLVVAKGGPKLVASVPENDDVCHIVKQPGAETQRRHCKIGSLTPLLHYSSGREVLDKTGLTGYYDFELHWTPENAPDTSPLAGGPSIFTAVQEQLGLKLEPSTAPLDVLVIDSAEPPSAN